LRIHFSSFNMCRVARCRYAYSTCRTVPYKTHNTVIFWRTESE
jgi:hypothetical protein